MAAKSLQNLSVVLDELTVLGGLICERRKHLRVSATTLAEAAGMSRASVHRVEQCEPSVTMGAYLNVLAALGLTACRHHPRSTRKCTKYRLPLRGR